MAASIPAQGQQFSFTKDGAFLDNQVSAGITVMANQAAAAIVAANAPFPAGTTAVGNLSATVSGNTGDLKFATSQGAVSFSGSASATSALAVYANPSDLIKDLSAANQQALDGIAIDGAGATQFVLLDWGYNISASATGSVALGGAATATL
jgi:hypothetical protein